MNFLGEAVKLKTRSEADVLADLAALTKSLGYVHALAAICHRDNFVSYRGELTPSDMSRLHSPNRLIGTEIATLLGLMVHQPLDLTLPTEEVIKTYVAQTDALMEELHRSLSLPMHESLQDCISTGSVNDIWQGEVMREPIFYGPESAYSFQYRDLFAEKYGPDDAWLVKNKGFSAAQARSIAHAMCLLMDERAAEMFAFGKATKEGIKTWLPTFELAPAEISHRSGEPASVVEAFIKAFTLDGNNSQFQTLGDFNSVAATPLIPTGNGTVLLFQHYAIYEALYESPFYWMLQDPEYKVTAANNRGAFTETYSARRLSTVFGDTNVHTNVNLHRGKNRVGEIDVLVIFGDRIIIVQAKAKKLTLLARKGNDNQLKADFAAAIQDSYNQGWDCANSIVAGGCRIETNDGRTVVLPDTIKEVYLFNVLSEHYPALAFQARQYLKYQSTAVIRPPFVMDVFLLDAMTEMLSTPLRLLSYVRMRLATIEKVSVSHELTALGFHLQRNLWLDDEYDMVMLDDSVSVSLDTAMMVRRDNLDGERTPPGILTRLAGTLYERLISQIEERADPATLELGFMLLSLGEESCRHIHQGLEIITQKTRADSRRHDVSLSLQAGNCGISIHCNPAISPEAIAALEFHCTKRKYAERADTWFGLSVSPNADIQFGVTMDFPWSPSEEMEELTRGMKTGVPVASALAGLSTKSTAQKVGRNDLCPCGSGRKFKKCCLSR